MPGTRNKKTAGTASGPETLLAQMDQLLRAALPYIGTAGWHTDVLARAARDIGLPSTQVHRLFPSGTKDLLRHFHDYADRGMLGTVGRTPGFAKKRVREKVHDAVMARLDFLTPHKAAMREALAHYACPWNTVEGVRALCHTLEAIWNAVGDTTTGTDRYSRRGALGGVYSATLLFWLNDTTPDSSATRAFLNHRIAEAIGISKVVTGFRKRRTAAGE